MTYKLLRNIHLFAGLFCCAFLLMYGVSAVQMAHNRWFSMKPRVIEETFELAPGQDARPVAAVLMQQHGARGELMQPKQTPAGWDFRIERPGTVWQVSYDRTTGKTHVRTNIANFMGMLNRIHHIGGLWHNLLLVDIWGIFVGLVSAGLLILGVTGIWMWFQRQRERRTGLILLAASLAYCLTVLVLIRIQ